MLDTPSTGGQSHPSTSAARKPRVYDVWWLAGLWLALAGVAAASDGDSDSGGERSERAEYESELGHAWPPAGRHAKGAPAPFSITLAR